MFAPSRVGEVFHLNHTTEGLVLTALSVKPVVLDIQGFITATESQTILQNMQQSFQPSRTGAVIRKPYAKRTSETAWYSSPRLARDIKRRGFPLVGLNDFRPELSDGLQVLRYNQSKAYVSHMDYLRVDQPESTYDYDSSGKGGNRFATILVRKRCT